MNIHGICDVWVPTDRHEWRLAQIESRYADGAWAQVEAKQREHPDAFVRPVSVGTMGLFYCRKCLAWATNAIPDDLPGFGADATH